MNKQKRFLEEARMLALELDKAHGCHEMPNAMSLARAIDPRTIPDDVEISARRLIGLFYEGTMEGWISFR